MRGEERDSTSARGRSGGLEPAQLRTICRRQAGSIDVLSRRPASLRDGAQALKAESLEALAPRSIG